LHKILLKLITFIFLCFLKINWINGKYRVLVDSFCSFNSDSKTNNGELMNYDLVLKGFVLILILRRVSLDFARFVSFRVLVPGVEA
jgi:hypothetical protein